MNIPSTICNPFSNSPLTQHSTLSLNFHFTVLLSTLALAFWDTYSLKKKPFVFSKGLSHLVCSRAQALQKGKDGVRTYFIIIQRVDPKKKGKKLAHSARTTPWGTLWLLNNRKNIQVRKKVVNWAKFLDWFKEEYFPVSTTKREAIHLDWSPPTNDGRNKNATDIHINEINCLANEFTPTICWAFRKKIDVYHPFPSMEFVSVVRF